MEGIDSSTATWYLRGRGRGRGRERGREREKVYAAKLKHRKSEAHFISFGLL